MSSVKSKTWAWTWNSESFKFKSSSGCWICIVLPLKRNFKKKWTLSWSIGKNFLTLPTKKISRWMISKRILLLLLNKKSLRLNKKSSKNMKNIKNVDLEPYLLLWKKEWNCLQIRKSKLKSSTKKEKRMSSQKNCLICQFQSSLNLWLWKKWIRSMIKSTIFSKISSLKLKNSAGCLGTN